MAECLNPQTDYTESKYTTVVDTLNKDKWSDIMQLFDDSSIYQSWSYGAIRWGQDHLGHLVLMKEDETVAAAQVRTISLPFVGPCMAYVTWGPLWRRRGEQRNYETFRQVTRALYSEYVSKRKMLLRLVPNEFIDEDNTVEQILKEEGFCKQPHSRLCKTILNDIRPPLEDLLKRLHKSWRQNLRRAERNQLDILEGTDSTLYETFTQLYKEMYGRKQFSSGADINEFRKIQQDLPSNLKMNIAICLSGGQPVSALVWSAIGNTGISIFSATGNKGLKSYGAYLLRWQMVKRLKEMGCHFLNQGGIDPEINPGGYTFKAGMGGVESKHIGYFDACNSKLKYHTLRCAENLKSYIQTIC